MPAAQVYQPVEGVAHAEIERAQRAPAAHLVIQGVPGVLLGEDGAEGRVDRDAGEHRAAAAWPQCAKVGQRLAVQIEAMAPAHIDVPCVVLDREPDVQQALDLGEGHVLGAATCEAQEPAAVAGGRPKDAKGARDGLRPRREVVLEGGVAEHVLIDELEAAVAGDQPDHVERRDVAR